MHFSLVRISTPDMPDTHGFDDVLLPLKYAFAHLGYEVEIRVNSFNPHSRNICLGANYDPEQKWIKLPPQTIVMNLEQLEAEGYPWLKDGQYFDLLARHETWDFSRRNLDYLRGKGIEGRFLPIGYVPEMTRLEPCPAPVHDVLFYGSMTPRRRYILDELEKRGLKVNRLAKAYGQKRDQAIFSAKVFLNIHHSLPASLEIVRLGYVLANKRAVVSELAPDTYHYPELAGACAFREYEQLVEAVAELAADESECRKQAERGFEAFSGLRLDQALEELVGRRVRPLSESGSSWLEPRPNHLRAGSGLSFLNQALNVDSRRFMRPDLALDLSSALPEGRVFQTERFGDIEMSPGSFDLISCPELLATTNNPDQLMTNFLELLKPGGRLILTAPYQGAVWGTQAGRSFTEKSWLRYTRQARLIGWETSAFELESSEWLLSETGRILQAKGLPLEALRLRGGAIEGLRTVLRKRILTPEEITETAYVCRDIFSGPAIDWRVEDEESLVDPVVQAPLPSAFGLRCRLFRLRLNEVRYALNIKFKLARKHGRYEDKLLETRRDIAETRRWLKMYGWI